MTIDEAAQHRIARNIAYSAMGLSMDDVYQDIRERFLRYPPQTDSYAYRTARNVVASAYRYEARHPHIPLPDWFEGVSDDTALIEARDTLFRLPVGLLLKVRDAQTRRQRHYRRQRLRMCT